MAEKSADLLVEEACLWVKSHNGQFRTIMSLVHEQVDDGNPCVQRGDIALLARARGFGWSEVREFKCDHNLWAVLTRYMVMLSPRLTKALCFRKSKLDDVDLQAKWYEIVPGQTHFYASGWREAQRVSDDLDSMREVS